ncbi:MAG: drug/metabolite transporter (DMT)-like permease [Planctomycetota bacterium]|jgi:drug/metabolite transporter (DMT)-like permease
MLMHSASLYVISVLIWGSTWYAIKFQLGTVEAEISLVYRFAFASLILILFCIASRRKLTFSVKQHCFSAAQGLFLFSSNYLIFYWATELLTSGIVALLFSTVVLLNIINGAIFMGLKVSSRVIGGATIGIIGIATIFWSEVSAIENNSETWRGLWMCLLATFFASLGNILSLRNQQNGMPVVQTNAWGMAYGALVMTAYAFVTGTEFNFEYSYAYTLSLLYLAFFGSVLAFGCYLTLVGRIGADKAGYTAVLFPIIALAISTLFEDYHWTLLALFGFVLVLLGNYLVLTKSRRKPISEIQV